MKEKLDKSKVGGLTFYLSLFALLILALSNSLSLFWVILESSFGLVAGLVLGAAIGVGFAHLVVRAHLSVFIHELKHKILANLCGNKARALEVNSDTGSFTYAYTKDTAHYNGFISIAPYWLPLFQFLTIAIGCAAFYSQPIYLAPVIGMGIGIDLLLNYRDAGPHQTDFTQLNGGYGVGISFSILANIFFVTTSAAFALGQLAGLAVLFNGLWRHLLFFVEIVRGV